jgi:hypothetical protein
LQNGRPYEHHVIGKRGLARWFPIPNQPEYHQLAYYGVHLSCDGMADFFNREQKKAAMFQTAERCCVCSHCGQGNCMKSFVKG